MNVHILKELTVHKLRELKNSEPEQHQYLVNSIVEMAGIATEILKNSPEFRRQFAKIHAEFLKYPECKEVIDEAYRVSTAYLEQSSGELH